MRQRKHHRDGDCESKYQNPELVAEQWLQSAERDMRVAQSLFDAGHYSWAAFACQQALEKLLKAGYVSERHKIPPHVHKLERLSAIMKLNPSDEYISNIIEIDECYTSTRYPGYKHDMCPQTREESGEILEKARRTYAWVKHELQFKKP